MLLDIQKSNILYFMKEFNLIKMCNLILASVYDTDQNNFYKD